MRLHHRCVSLREISNYLNQPHSQAPTSDCNLGTMLVFGYLCHCVLSDLPLEPHSLGTILVVGVVAIRVDMSTCGTRSESRVPCYNNAVRSNW